MNTKVTPTPIEIAPIQYRHYKGGLYQVLHTALDSETLQTMVVYRSLQTQDVWVRSAHMFTQEVLIDGQWVPRFKPLVNDRHTTEK